jgi:hypothetical protein
MGSNFFQKLVNPLSAIDPAQLAGSNSSLGRLSYYDPLVNSGVGKVLSPSAYAAAQAYGVRTHEPLGPGGAYAGAAPTLATANTQYQAPAAPAVPQPSPATVAPQPGVTPRMWAGNLFASQPPSSWG